MQRKQMKEFMGVSLSHQQIRLIGVQRCSGEKEAPLQAASSTASFSTAISYLEARPYVSIIFFTFDLSATSISLCHASRLESNL